MSTAYSFEVVSHDTVALMDENGFDVGHLTRQELMDGSHGFRTDDEEWQGIIDALWAATGGTLTVEVAT
jgi:hypothetical protein